MRCIALPYLYFCALHTLPLSCGICVFMNSLNAFLRRYIYLNVCIALSHFSLCTLFSPLACHCLSTRIYVQIYNPPN
jgi:hypothetical protein